MPTGPIASTITQFGLRVTLPVFKVAELRYIALLGCSHINSYGTEALVCLVLQGDITDVRNKQERPHVYHCLTSYRDEHCILIGPELASRLKWKLEDIHISLQPTSREESISIRMSIAQLMSSSPQRPYQFTPAAIARWESFYDLQDGGQRLVLSDVLMPLLPWTGSSPVVLLFDHVGGFGATYRSTITLGRCTIQGSTIPLSGKDGDASIPRTSTSTESCTLGQHYAVVSHGLREFVGRPDMLPPSSSHSCEHDHLDFTPISEDAEWAEHRLDGGLTIVYKFDGDRCILRDLYKNFGLGSDV